MSQTIRYKAVFVVLLLARCALAATPDETAAEHHARGTKAFNLTAYDEAIVEYEAAYRLNDDPSFLYNIAQAHRLAGHLEKALRFYRNFLRLVPDTPLKGAVDARIGDVEEALAKQSKPPNDTIPDARKTSVPPSEPPRGLPVVDAPSGNRTLMFSGVGVAAAGVVVALGGGIGFGLACAAKADAIAAQAHNHQPYDPALESNKNLFNTLSIVSAVVGGAVAVTGFVLLVLGRLHKAPPEKREAWRLLPALDTSIVGLAFSGSF